MSVVRDISPIQATEITERIGQTFDFVRDMLETPEILDEIPDGAVLYTRAVAWCGECLDLVAHRTAVEPEGWVARVSSPAHIAESSQRWIALIETRGVAGKWGSPPTFPVRGSTPVAALDALEEKLHDEDSKDPRRRGAATG